MSFYSEVTVFFLECLRRRRPRQTCSLLIASLLFLAPVEVLASLAEEPRVPTSGHVRALVIFARFSDDGRVFTGTSPSERAWSDPDRLPDFAYDVLSRTTVPPFDEQSLTDYFYQQSRQKLVLYGEPYPRIVIVPGNESNYLTSSRPIQLTEISIEILHTVNEDPDFDLADFDADGDGVIDYVFVVMRRIEKNKFFLGASGYSSLNYSSEAEFGHDPTNLKRVYGRLGAYIRYNSSGVVIPSMDLTRLMAHEFGHDLWTNLSINHHRPLIDANGVPEGEANKIGYALMVGTLGGSVAHLEPTDVRGDYTIGAVERESLNAGWIDCSTLESDRKGVRISDLYSSTAENCFKLSLPTRTGIDRTLYLSNRQRVGFFDREHTDPGFPQYTAGLRTTGLLVTATRSEPFYPDPRYAVVAADNTLACNDSSYTYEGDLFGPNTRVQLTPWTRPNISAFSRYPADLVVEESTFQAIDSIRYTGGPGGEMAFDYLRDFRDRPIIREDSWMGNETRDFRFTADVIVTNGSTLTIETDVRIAGRLKVDSGSRVVVNGSVLLEAGAVLEMEAQSEVSGQGQLVSAGTLVVDPEATLSLGVITAINDRAETESPHQFSLAQNYPNPFGAATTISYILPRESSVTLSVHDLQGRVVLKVEESLQPAGEHKVHLTAAGALEPLSSGMYVYTLDTGSERASRPMVLVR
jgi:hypothetical protein